MIFFAHTFIEQLQLQELATTALVDSAYLRASITYKN
jgi:hypothetical protein